MLISIEGIDGSGKSTLVHELEHQLADLDPLFTREPGSTWIGDYVRRAISEQIDPIAEALLFVADHALHIATVIRPALENGRLVISDRYSDSRYAYQAVTLDGIMPDPIEWLRSIHDDWTIRPDLTFLLVIPAEEAIHRLSDNREREHFEEREVLERVQAEYLELARADPERFIIIDAMKEKKEIVSFVAEEIRHAAGLSRSRHHRS